jgi:hypothetical protein
MSKNNSQFTSSQVKTDLKTVLEEIIRDGARKLLAIALEAEINDF